jgi:manganese/zinc/iron transport system substrate-binding protein
VRAVATTGMIADAVKAVGGARVEVEALMGPGIDPHQYKAGERDVIKIAEADVIFYSGLHLEAKMGDVFTKIADRLRTVAGAEAVPSNELLAPPEFEGAHDPHVWFDVQLWRHVVEAVRDGLTALDPSSSEEYGANAEAHLAELDDLDDYVRRRASSVPEDKRVLITAHDAFNYFGRAYGFEVLALQGISTVAEAGTGDIRDLAETIAARRIPAIFVETSVSTRFVTAVQEATRARGFEVAVGGELFSDALGDDGTPEGTYIGMIRHNIDTIVEALLR